MAFSEDKRNKAVGLSITEMMFCITAFLLMWIGSMRCDFIQFKDESGIAADNPPTLQFGMWRWQSYTYAVNVDGAFIFETCNYYPDYQEIDPTWKTAQAFSILAFIFGIFVLVGACAFACTIDAEDNFLTKSWLAPALYLATAIFQGLSLLLLSSNACNKNLVVKTANQTTFAQFPDTCSLNTGANLIISATVMWFAAAFASFAARKIERKAVEEEKGEAVKAQEKEDVEAAEETPEQAQPVAAE